MHPSHLDASDPSTDPLLEAVASEARRAVLSRLLEHDGPVALGTLAASVTAPNGLHSTDRLDDHTADGGHYPEVSTTRLQHVHLPALASVDLVEWDPEDGCAWTTDHPVLADPRFRRAIAVDDDGWDLVLEAMADVERRLVLAVLKRSDDDIEPRELARRILERSPTSPDVRTSSDDVEDALTALHHLHLPKLRRAGLVTADGGPIRYVGHPELDDWFGVDVETPEDPVDRADTGSVS